MPDPSQRLNQHSELLPAICVTDSSKYALCSSANHLLIYELDLGGGLDVIKSISGYCSIQEPLNEGKYRELSNS